MYSPEREGLLDRLILAPSDGDAAAKDGLSVPRSARLENAENENKSTSDVFSSFRFLQFHLAITVY